jgi:outer membrane protein assembly factor BamE (lipoprotein component of BamABCDE complex)
VKPTYLSPLLLIFLVLASCQPTARSHQSYDQIRQLVAGHTAAEVELLLGKPDVRSPVRGDSRWVWWNYTFLDGDQYAPEIRGQIVHLEITFQNPQDPDALMPLSQWRVNGSLSVSYSKAADGR